MGDVGEAHLPRHVRPEGLARLGEVGEGGVEVEDPEAGGGVEFAALVGVEEVAQLVLHLLARAGGQEVDETVDELGLARLVSHRRQLTAPHDAVACAGLPRHPEAEAEIRADLLEHECGAEDVLVQRALQLGVSRPDLAERLPGGSGLPDAQDGEAARAPRALGDLVVGVVGEERILRIHAAGREPPGARDEEPHVTGAHERHEERGHPVIARDAVEAAAVQVDQGGGALLARCAWDRAVGVLLDWCRGHRGPSSGRCWGGPFRR